MATQYLLILFQGCLFICLRNYILLPGMMRSINVGKGRAVKGCSETHQTNAMHLWQLNCILIKIEGFLLPAPPQLT